MKAHQLFQSMSQPLAADLFTFLQSNEKPVYKAAIQGLANQRNLRAVFVERKPRDERHAWMRAALGRPASDTLATHLLQAWLLGANKPMLREFLGALEIPHEEDGTVEEIPPCPPKESLQAAIERLLSKYPAEAVAVYLHAFREMDSSLQWPALNEILNDNPRLQLAAAS
ncbi:MAG TPA: hypothetical protein VGP40_03970 [Chthoniobacterales bacterium]|nr:hypothetical protein [Chthoniobacterales bacterium]